MNDILEKFKTITEKDLYYLKDDVIRIVNKAAIQLGIEPLSKMCLDCFRKKYWEVEGLINKLNNKDTDNE